MYFCDQGEKDRHRDSKTEKQKIDDRQAGKQIKDRQKDTQMD